MPKPQLVRSAPSPDLPRPPCELGPIGASLWADIVSSYEFGDRGSYEVLYQSCAAADRADRCRQQINRDGELLKVGKTVRSHPLIRDEIQLRALVMRGLTKLGLDLEPLRSGPGRPSGR